MRYDAEKGIIEIHLGEFVNIARRGISPSVSYDEDEPNISEIAEARLSRIFGEMHREVLTLEFGSGEYNFKLVGQAEGISGNSITIARTVSSNPHRPRKSMFSKKAVVISTTAGVGSGKAIKPVVRTLAYWGIPYIKSYGLAVQASN